jgi:hypothetical protein
MYLQASSKARQSDISATPTTKKELQTILSSFKLNLIKRGYNEIEIDDNINQALSNNRAEFLNKKSKKHTKKIPLVLSTKYNPCIRKIKQCLVKHWQLLKHNEICRDIFTKEPIIAYKKHRNLGDILTSSKINRYANLEKADP